MPVFDGWQTLWAIRALPHGGTLPIIAVTAHAMVGDREAILAHGFEGYVAKPLNLRGLLDIVGQHI
jgi:CheY-like chemotaxis protein